MKKSSLMILKQLTKLHVDTSKGVSKEFAFFELKQNINKFLNGPEGFSSSMTMQSAEFISYNLKRLKSSMKFYEDTYYYDSVKLCDV